MRYRYEPPPPTPRYAATFLPCREVGTSSALTARSLKVAHVEGRSHLTRSVVQLDRHDVATLASDHPHPPDVVDDFQPLCAHDGGQLCLQVGDTGPKLGYEALGGLPPVR